MKIVHVINYFQPQLGYQEFFLAREHARLGHEVTVITSNRYFPFTDYKNTIYPILGKRKIKKGVNRLSGFDVVRLPVLFEQKAVRVLLKGLKKELKRIKPDIVITHGEKTFNALFTVLYKKKFNYRLVIDSHSVPYKINFRFRFLNPLRKFRSIVFKYIFNKFVWNRQDVKWVAVADECANYLIENCNLSREEIELIPLGTDVDRFKPDIKMRKFMRKSLGIKEDEIVLIYTGKMIYEKDPALILEASKEYAEKYGLVYLFIGNISRDYKARFLPFMGSLGRRIIHLDTLPNSELAKYYMLADIAVWPKQVSISNLDAMSSGIPIIISNNFMERIKNYNGIGISDGNLSDLRKAILTLTETPALRKGMGRRSLELAVRELDWKRISQKFIDFALQ